MPARCAIGRWVQATFTRWLRSVRVVAQALCAVGVVLTTVVHDAIRQTLTDKLRAQFVLDSPNAGAQPTTEDRGEGMGDEGLGFRPATSVAAVLRR
jgi:hypothetical protein